MSTTSFFTSSESQKRWRDHMRHNYISNNRICPCVFQVPQNERETNPKAYDPQIMGLGPYHHFRPELQLMETQKRAAVKDYLRIADFKCFINLVESSPEEFEPVIRSCYDRYLDLDKETLSWIVIVDGIVLLHLIDTCLGPEEERQRIYSKVEKLVPDVFMLENQIPIILILEMCEVLKLSFAVPTEDELFDKFRRFCSEQSPLELTSKPELRKEAFDKNSHMLHFLYQMIMKHKRPDDDDQGHSQCQIDDGISDPSQSKIKSKEDQDKEGKSDKRDEGTLRKRMESVAREARKQGSEFFGAAIEEFNSALTTATNAGLVPKNLQTVTQILQTLEKTFHLNENKDALSADKIEIPSVSRLIAILNIKFRPLPESCGIGDIDLNSRNEFYLPVIHMRASSEVILRNLVAYEATISKHQAGSTLIRSYVDLMCGIIKSEKDVNLLTTAGIIKGELSDQEIVKICSGINKSDEKPDEESKVRCSVQNANNQFNNARIVKFCSRLSVFLSVSMKILRAAFPSMVLLFLGFQSACEILNCRTRCFRGIKMRGSYLGDYAELGPQSNFMLPRKMLSY